MKPTASERAVIARGLRALRQGEVEVTSERAGRLWRSIDSARSEEAKVAASPPTPWRRGRFVPIVAVAVAAGVAGVIAVRSDPVPHGTAPAAQDARYVSPAPGFTIELIEGARFSAGPTLRLQSGRVTLTGPRVVGGRAPTEDLWAVDGAIDLFTPHSRLKFIGGRADVLVDDGRTRIEVDRGLVFVQHGTERKKLTAGRFIEVDSQGYRERPVTPARAAPAANTPASQGRVPKTLRPRREILQERSPAAVDETRRPGGARLSKSARQPDRGAVAPKPTPAALARAAVGQARAVVQRDPSTAARLARAVLEQRPKPEVAAEAMMVMADAHRLRGALREAATTYLLVASAAGGQSFQEEALLRAAELWVKLAEPGRALDTLRRADREVKAVALLPERRAVELKVVLARDGPSAAADLADRYRSITGAAMASVRLTIAAGLAVDDRARAIRLIDELMVGGASQATLARAQRLRAAIQKR